MRIRLLSTLPIEDKHGMIKGRNLSVVSISPDYLDGKRTLDRVVWRVRSCGELVSVLGSEAEITEYEYRCANCDGEWVLGEDVCRYCGLEERDIVYPPTW